MDEVRFALALFAGLSSPVFVVIGLLLTGRTVLWLATGHNAIEALANQVRALAYIVASLAAMTLWGVLAHSGNWP